MPGAPLTALLLPGLDGTGRLFGPFVAALSSGVAPRVAAYPTASAQSYEALEEQLASSLPAGPYAIIAESFAGPLALRLASRFPAGLVAVVLVATFVKSPVAGALAASARALARPWLPALPLPHFAARRWLLGDEVSGSLTDLVAANLRDVAAAVLTARVRAVLDVDATAALRACPVPMLYLAGRQDRLVSPGTGEELRRVRPDLTLAAIDAPHLVLQVAPVAAAQVIEAFLARVLGDQKSTPP